MDAHVPEQVLHQFVTQYIPDVVDEVAHIHRSSKCQCDWRQEHSAYISQWDNRANRLQSTRHLVTFFMDHMSWYWGITRCWIIQHIHLLVIYMSGGIYEWKLVISWYSSHKVVICWSDFVRFMIQIDGLIHPRNMVDENLIEDTRRVSILQSMSTFIRELIRRRQFAYLFDAPNHLIDYAQRTRQSPNSKCEVV